MQQSLEEGTLFMSNLKQGITQTLDSYYVTITYIQGYKRFIRFDLDSKIYSVVHLSNCKFYVFLQKI